MKPSRHGAFFAAALTLAAATLAVASSRSSAAAGGDAHSAKAGRLVAFHSCSELLRYTKSQAARFVGPWGLSTAGGRALPPVAVATTGSRRDSSQKEGVDFSGTNVQEEGVDEPDMVKTDGSTLFAVANGSLQAVDVRGHQPRLLDTLKLDGGWSQELLLHGNRLLVLSRGGYWAEPMPGLAARMMPWVPSSSVLTEVDVSNPKALRAVRTLTLDGAYVAARLVGHTARIVASAQVPQRLKFEQPTGGTQGELAAAKAHNEAVLGSSGVAGWLPGYRIARPGKAAGASRPLVQCRNVRRPAAFSGLGMLTVLTVDLAKGLEPVDSTALMTDARIVYASPGSLYVATERWADRPGPGAPTQAGSGVSTAIHRFDISDPARAQYRGSGAVSGYLLSQWSLSERRGVLRVVSTETPAWWGPGGESESFLTTLRPKDGALVQAGRVGGLGKGERVYSVRFVDDAAYVVTFRQVDPLYTVDLSDPDRPRVLGELKLAGYSSYLHPVGGDLLLGVGQDADEQGRVLGTQLSVFDVSDLRHPARLSRVQLGRGWSEAELDHHAFLFWPRTGLVVLPFDQRALGFRVGRSGGLDQIGRIEHGAGRLTWTPGIRRSLVVGDSVLTVSNAGVKSSRLATLAEQGWVAFPPPPTPSP